MDLRSSFWAAVDWLERLAKNLYFWGGIALLFALGLGVYFVVDGVVMPSYTRHGVSARVPDVETLPFAKAKDAMQEHGLQVEREVGRYNPNVGQNVVVDQTPLPNSKVKPGRRVYLTVNAGEVPMVKIPDLTGMSVREAKNRVTSIGLRVGRVSEDPIPSPYANTITKQNPTPGDSTQKGKAVSLWYSAGLGDKDVGVPNVVGYTVKDARETLLESRLRSVVVDTNPGDTSTTTSSDSLKEVNTYILRQGHAPGASVRAGTEVRLFTTPDASKALERRDAVAQEDTTDSSE